jgi:hypothetical protein
MLQPPKSMHATRELIVLRRLMCVVLLSGTLPVGAIVCGATLHGGETRHPADDDITKDSTLHRNDGEEMVLQNRSVSVTVRPKVP